MGATGQHYLVPGDFPFKGRQPGSRRIRLERRAYVPGPRGLPNALCPVPRNDTAGAGFAREGEGRLEEPDDRGEESAVPRLLLPDLCRVPAPDRRMEVHSWLVHGWHVPCYHDHSVDEGFR